MTGIIVAQLFRLQHIANPNLNLGFFVLGVPVAASFIGLAILVLLIGAYRFWRQQRAMIRGMVYAGGWDISLIMLLSIIVSAAQSSEIWMSLTLEALPDIFCTGYGH